jgi:tRNA U55 pseudouridine synthase TruB
VGAHLSSLRRIQSGGYSIKEAIALENFFLDIDNNQNWSQKSYFKNLNQISSEYPAFTVTGKDLKLLRNGQVSYDLERRLVFEQKKCYRSGRSSVVKIYSPELKLLSLLEIKKGNGVKVKRTFQSFC